MDEATLTKKKAPKDPYAAREASKYENPIASREMILETMDQATGPMSHRALYKTLGLQTEDEAEALRRRLIAMERDGQVISNRKGEYGRIDKMDLVRGRVQGHRDGFGFVIPADGSPDLYLTNRQMRKVFSGDEVLVRPGPVDFRGRREGSIVEVLVRNTQQLVGRYFSESGVKFVRPDNPRIAHEILIPPEDSKGARPGQFVLVEIARQPDRRQPPIGRVVEILGDHLAPGMEIDVAIRSNGIPHQWPPEVLEEVEQFGREVEEKDKGNRIDLRHLPFVTIDGEDARDFDDAVYCEKKRWGGWRLFVAIADVSHYVAVGSALDREAVVRGNSVYFPDFVVPMLPEVLSNGLCSLNPEVDRLCMVCEMTISGAGKITGYKFYESVIHSHARLTYTQVGQVIAERDNKRSGVRKNFHKLLSQIDELYALYRALREQRTKRGAIDFETSETRIIFDENRKIKRIVPVVRNDAHKLIEECMLAANVCTAKFLESQEIPALYRVHEGPREEKIELLHEFLGELGLSLRGGEITPDHFQEVLRQIEGRPDAHLIQTVMLRSMNQAVYQPQNIGHFGLAYDAYAHFTSPIRRYPDLIVHRAIRAAIYAGRKAKTIVRTKETPRREFHQSYPYTQADMLSLGEQCSATERRADDATRDVISWLKCEYMQDHVGEEFEGVVSSVVGFGLFVELKDIYVEGLVHITSLPQDYYHFEAAQHRLIGERTRRVFRLGDELCVQVVRVDLDERKIDFELKEIRPRKREKVKVSETAKQLAEEYEKEKTRRAGGRVKKRESASGAKKKSKSKAKAATGKEAKAKSGTKTKVKSKSRSRRK